MSDYLDEHPEEVKNAAYYRGQVKKLEEEVRLLKPDAERYRWLKEQKGLDLRADYMFWTRKDGTRFQSSHRLCGNDTGYAAYETLDETIDEAMIVDANRCNHD